MRQLRCAARCLLTVGVMAVSVATAVADSILITSGSLTIRPGEVTSARQITLAGDGFTFKGVGGNGIFAPQECQLAECFPGRTLDLRGMWSGMDLPGVATFEGRTFTAVGAGNSDTSLFAEWTGMLNIPA